MSEVEKAIFLKSPKTLDQGRSRTVANWSRRISNLMGKVNCYGFPGSDKKPHMVDLGNTKRIENGHLCIWCEEEQKSSAATHSLPRKLNPALAGVVIRR